MKILITDTVPKQAIECLTNEGFKVDYIPGIKEDELISKIRDYDGLIIRSGTKVTKRVIEAAKNLKIIGRAGIGVDNIEVEEATRNNICVMNTPFGNVNAAAEHTIAMMMSLIRNIPHAHHDLKYKHEWNKSKYKGIELKGKTLGIIGIGKVGNIVARIARSFEANVVGYDKFVKNSTEYIEWKEFDYVLKNSDIITVHVPLTPETKGMISKKEFSQMKDNVYIINVARGGIINEFDLYDALKSKRIKGAAIDVFETEPDTKNKLFELDNVIVTPHLGASTIEAQENVSIDIAKQFINAFKHNKIENSVNKITKLKD